MKGFALVHPDEVEVTERGVVENRRFLLVDGEGRRLRSSLTVWPIAVRGAYDARAETLQMSFPTARASRKRALGEGELVRPEFGHGVVEARIVEGDWNEKLSAPSGHEVRIARPEQPGACQAKVISLLSGASIERLEREAGQSVDLRRFRLLFSVDGCSEHEEDEWIGLRVRIGEAIVRVGGPNQPLRRDDPDPRPGRGISTRCV